MNLRIVVLYLPIGRTAIHLNYLTFWLNIYLSLIFFQASSFFTFDDHQLFWVTILVRFGELLIGTFLYWQQNHSSKLIGSNIFRSALIF